MHNLVFFLAMSILLNLLLGFVLYFVYANYSRLQYQLKREYNRYLNNRAEHLISLLYAKLKEFPKYGELSSEERDNFNRALGGVFHDFVNMKNDKNEVLNYHYITKTFLVTIPNSFDEHKPSVERCLYDFFSKLDGKKDVHSHELMLELMLGNDIDFEEQYKRCHKAIESIYDVPW